MEHAAESTKQKGGSPAKGASARPAYIEEPPLHPMLRLQRQVGNQAVLAMLRSGALQAKLAVGSPDDPAEKQADEVAERVMRKPSGAGAIGACNCTAGGEMCEECRKKELEAPAAAPVIRRRAGAGGAGSFDAPAFVQQALGGAGRPLDAATRVDMEGRFGGDFSAVRIHTDQQAADSAKSIDALAYTVGDHIAFGEGQYAPRSDAGGRVLAHELTHVLQQRSNMRSTGQFSVRRQPAPQPVAGPPVVAPPVATPDAQRPPAASPAGPTDSGPLRPSSDFYFFRGVMMTTDPAFMTGELRRLIGRFGLKGGNFWFDALQGKPGDIPLPFSAHTGALGGGWRPRTPLDAQRDIDNDARKDKLAPTAVPLAMSIYPLVRKEALDFLVAFQAGMGTTLETVLMESQTRIETERVNYGIKKKGGEGFFSPLPTYEAENTVAFQGLVGAAKDLLEIRNRIDDLAGQQQRLMASRGGAQRSLPEANRERHEALGQQIKALEEEYGHARTSAVLRHPTLAAILDDGGPTRLQTLARGDLKSIRGGHNAGITGAAHFIGAALDSRQESIDSVRSKIKDAPEKLWNISSIVATTLATNTQSKTMAKKLVEEKLEAIALDAQIKGLFLAAIALALALPSAGTSLAAGAAVATGVMSGYQALQSIKNYQLQMALTETDLDKRAYAIASEEPSAFWVALDVVFAVADGAAALKAFRAVKSEARSALVATDGVEAAAAEERMVNAADAAEGTQKSRLGQRLRETLARMRKTSPEARALGGVGKAEGEAVAHAGEAISKEAKSAETIAQIGGHQVKVTPSGHLVICTECSWLRERFAAELAANKALLARIEKAEQAAKSGPLSPTVKSEIESLAKDLQGAQKARIAAELGPEAAAALEKLNSEMDVLRGKYAPELGANPAMEAEARRIEGITDPAAKAREMSSLREKLSGARAAQLEGPRLASGAIDLDAWGTQLKAAGVKGDIDDIVRRAKGTGHDAIAARGELRALERSRARGYDVEALSPPTGKGTAQGVKTPEAKVTLGGEERRLEVKTATEPPKASTMKGQIDKAYAQIKAGGKPGELSLDWTEVNLAGSEFQNAGDIEALLRGKMTNDRLREIRSIEVIWKDSAGRTWVTRRLRGADGAVGDIVTELL
jgi:hypothetical protein